MNEPEFDLNNELKRIFPVAIPEILKGMPQDIGAKLSIAIQRQNVKSVKDINYHKLIQDVGVLFAGDLIKMAKKKLVLTKEEILHRQVITRTLFAGYYYPRMNDQQFNVYHKVQIAYFLRKFLQAFT